MSRRANYEQVRDQTWTLILNDDGTMSYDQVRLAVLLDIREELRLANTRLRRLDCVDFLRIPSKLERIARNTTKPKKKKNVAK